MSLFLKLSVKEIEDLLKFPAYISILAAFRNTKLEEGEKKAAIKFSHTQTFISDPLLKAYYKEADKVFEKNIEQLDRDLPKNANKREAAIIKELKQIEKIILKLGIEFASTMNRSMNAFTRHVSKAHYNVLTDYVFPLTALGLAD